MLSCYSLLLLLQFLSLEMATIISTNVLKQEADDHLRDIRRRKGVDVSNGQQSDNVEDLDRALNM
jgi:hypothetical protein